MNLVDFQRRINQQIQQLKLQNHNLKKIALFRSLWHSRYCVHDGAIKYSSTNSWFYHTCELQPVPINFDKNPIRECMVWSPWKGTCGSQQYKDTFFAGIPLKDEILVQLKSNIKIPLNSVGQHFPVYLFGFYHIYRLSNENTWTYEVNEISGEQFLY